jgi:hypothetical protein
MISTIKQSNSNRTNIAWSPRSRRRKPSLGAAAMRRRRRGDAVGVRVDRAQQSALRQLRRQRRDLFVYSSTGLQVYESDPFGGDPYSPFHAGAIVFLCLRSGRIAFLTPSLLLFFYFVISKRRSRLHLVLTPSP